MEYTMIIKPAHLKKEFDEACRGEIFKRGLTTGFPDLDENIKLAKSYLTIITGYPGSGKSEWLDAVLLNMTLLHNWKIMYFSPENHPVEQHMAKLAEKYIGCGVSQFTTTNRDESFEYLTEHFTWTYPEDPTLDIILSNAFEVYQETGLDALVIDPWNALTSKRDTQLIHEDLGRRLTKTIKFARDNDILVCVVAHPSKPLKDKQGNIGMPNLYDISDGAMWRNKADYGIVCHRQDMSKNELIISVQKIKQKWMGKLGMKVLQYDWRSGRFKCDSEEDFYLPTEITPPF